MDLILSGLTIWPNAIKDKSVRVLIANVRRWLGDSPDGRAWLPDARDTNSLYQIRPSYLLDWHLMRRLQTRARRCGKDGTEDLRTALPELRQIRDQLVTARGHEVPEELPPATFNAIEELFRQ